MGLKTVNDSVNNSESYKDGYYVGTVTNNTDTFGIARVQVHVAGLYDTDMGPVPWAGPLKDSPFGYGTTSGGQQYGVYGYPQVGSKVKVELQNGDEHKPLYTTLYTAPDAHPWFNTASRWGYVDPSGNSLQVDMSANTWVWTHESGDSISFDGSGNVVKVVKGNDTTTVTGNEQHTISGALTFQVTGNANINCSEFNMTASGTATYTAATHQFNGPIDASSTIGAQGDITDSIGTGNGQTMANMRSAFNIHRHLYDDNGNQNETDVPIPQV